MEIEKLADRLKSRTPIILGSERFAKFAILLPLVEINDEIHVLFEVRSLQLRRQPGEVCFPGGRIDPGDRDEEHTAIRETSEELGISEDSITNISPLDYMISFGQIIYPFAGIIKTPSQIVPNPDEVEEVFTVPLAFLKEVKPETYHVNFKVEPEKNFPFDLIVGGENYNWQTRKVEEVFYYFEDKVIWGLTARILKHFLEIVYEDPDHTFD